MGIPLTPLREIFINALQHSRQRTQLQFYAFGVLVLRGRSVLRLPLEKRQELLDDALAKLQYPVLRSTQFDAKPHDLIRAAKDFNSRASSPSEKA